MIREKKRNTPSAKLRVLRPYFHCPLELGNKGFRLSNLRKSVKSINGSFGIFLLESLGDSLTTAHSFRI